MIAVFTGVNTPLGYDIRSFDIINGKPTKFVWMKIEGYLSTLKDYPKYKSLSACTNKKEFYQQFRKDDGSILSLF